MRARATRVQCQSPWGKDEKVRVCLSTGAVGTVAGITYYYCLVHAPHPVVNYALSGVVMSP